MKKLLNLCLFSFGLVGVNGLAAMSANKPAALKEETRLELYYMMIEKIARENGFVTQGHQEEFYYDKDHILSFDKGKQLLAESILLALDLYKESESLASKNIKYSRDHVGEEQTRVNVLKSLICNESMGLITISASFKSKMTTLIEYLDQNELRQLIRQRKGYESPDKSENFLNVLFQNVAKENDDKALLNLIIADFSRHKKADKKRAAEVSCQELEKRIKQAKEEGSAVVAEKYEEILEKRRKMGLP